MASGYYRVALGYSEWATRYRSECRVDLGTAEVAPLSLTELAEITDHEVGQLLAVDDPLAFGEPGGSEALRQAVARAFPGIVPGNVAICAGAGDALSSVTWALAPPGAHVIVEVPCHSGVVPSLERLGVQVTCVGAPADVDELVELIGPRTAAIVVTSPHNPTGRVLLESELVRLAGALDAVGGVLVVDEVFGGLTLGSGVPVPPVATLAPNGISIGSLSKTCGLPGLRIGWVTGPTLLIDDVRARQRWGPKCPPVTGEAIAKVALANHDRLLARGRALAFDTFAELSGLCERHPGVSVPLPDGGTVGFLRIEGADEDQWCAQTAERSGLLLAPGGACFGLPGGIRVNLGLHPRTRIEAMALLDEALAFGVEAITS